MMKYEIDEAFPCKKKNGNRIIFYLPPTSTPNFRKAFFLQNYYQVLASAGQFQSQAS